ncbi:MAG: NlpC/P60 family protein [Pseudomonadota bacterium]
MSVAIVSHARAWLGTPYMHQASVRGVGCDCLGLLRGIWREIHGAEPEAVPIYTADWSEPQGDERLFRAAHRHMQHVEGAWVAGQVLLFRMRDDAVAKHVGILSQLGETPQFIHAYAGHGVTESPLSRPWRNRIVARFEISQG